MPDRARPPSWRAVHCLTFQAGMNGSSGMRRVIFNQKGGVGKSTITANLAAISAQASKKRRDVPRVLLVDLDSQCNATDYILGGIPDDPSETVAGYLQEQLSFRLYPSELPEFIHESPFPGLHVLPAHKELDELQGKLESRYKIYKLREALEQLESSDAAYDEVWIDTPPALNFYTRSALIAAERCLIPFDCDAFSRQALYELLENVEEIRMDHNRDLEVEGIIVNNYQARANLPRQLVEELRAEELPVLDEFLSASVKVRESHQRHAPLIHLVPRHKLTEEFRALHRRIVDGA